MSNYHEYFAKKSRPKEVALDVVEYELQPAAAGIEVEEKRFKSTGELLAHVARETGRGP